jgi:uncharacterized protein YggE
MAAKKRGRSGDFPRVRPVTEPQAKPATQHSGPEAPAENTLRKETEAMPSQGFRTETPVETVTVIGEAVRRVLPERAEFLIEVVATGMTAAQALRDNYSKLTQVTQAVSPLGVQQTDLQTISMRVQNLYWPALQALPAYAGFPQIGQGNFSQYPVGPNIQPEVQFGSYHSTHTLRVHVREPGRVGEIADAAARAGATIVGAFSFRSADEAGARRAALEAAGKDARSKAEVLATTAGKQVGDAVAIAEEIVASNGTYTALRAAWPLAFGAGAPELTGDLEYYARVSASFRFQ